MKPTREQIIEWSREAGLAGLRPESDMTCLMRLVDRIFTAGQASAAQGVEPIAKLVPMTLTQVWEAFQNNGFGKARPLTSSDNLWLSKFRQGIRAAEAHHSKYIAPPTAAAIEAQVKEACIRVCMEKQPITREEAPGHWKAYEHEWSLIELTLNRAIEAIHALPPMFNDKDNK